MLYPNIENITPEILKKLIDDSQERREQMEGLYDRYKGCKEGVPILNRVYKIDGIEQKGKINNKLANDFFSEIVDMKVGFFCGVPIAYTIDKDNYSENDYETISDLQEQFNKINSISDLDSETAKMSTISGLCGRLYYYDDDSNVRAKLTNPWQLIFLGDSVDDPDQTINTYCTIDVDGTEIKHADIYNDTTIKYYEYKEYKGLASKVLDNKWVLVKEVAHLMPYNPLIGFCNNEEFLGDAEKVLTLIDDYDRVRSDISSEIEQFRLAYLAVYGMTVAPEHIEYMKQTGTFSFTDANCKAEWLTKQLDDLILEHHQDRSEKNIYRFSRTPNMNDQAFSGTITGVALKYKFRSFEDKCTTSELKFKKSLREQSKILAAIWKDSDSITLDYLDCEYVFTRKYPQNLTEEIDFLVKAKGVIPDTLAMSLVSFIENPEKVKEELDEQQQENLDDFLSRTKPTEPVDSSAPVSKPVPANMNGQST
jgi:SPP1 family phage portal protein